MKNIKTISSRFIIDKLLANLLLSTKDFEQLLHDIDKGEISSNILSTVYLDHYTQRVAPILFSMCNLHKIQYTGSHTTFRDVVILYTTAVILRFLNKNENYKKYIDTSEDVYLYLPIFIMQGIKLAISDEHPESILNSKSKFLENFIDTTNPISNKVDDDFDYSCAMSNNKTSGIPMETILLNAIENITELVGIEFFHIFNNIGGVDLYYGWRVIDALSSMILCIDKYMIPLKNITQSQILTIATMHTLIHFTANFQFDSESPLLGRLFNNKITERFDESNPFVELYIKFLSSDRININNIDKSSMTETNQEILKAIVNIINADNEMRIGDSSLALSVFVAIHTFYVIGSGMSGVNINNISKYLYGYNTTSEPNPLLTTALNISNINVIKEYLSNASTDQIDNIILTIFTTMYRHNELVDKNGGTNIAKGITMSDYLTSVCVNELL